MQQVIDHSENNSSTNTNHFNVKYLKTRYLCNQEINDRNG